MEGTTISELLRHYRGALLPAHGGDEARAILRLVFREKLDQPLPEMEPQRRLSPEEERALRTTLDRVVAGEPVQYALGTTVFRGLRIAVDPRVLIPRPETEEMVDHIVRSVAPPDRIIDVGTGSGCIALALKEAFPGAAVTGIDISAGALDLARRNAAANGLSVEWRQLDALADDLGMAWQGPGPQGRTLVVSNPPYVPLADKTAMAPAVVDHEPHLALFVADDDPQRFFRAIATAAFPALRPGDELWFEAHFRHAPRTAEMLRGMGFHQVLCLRDISGNPRFIQARR